MTDVHKYISFRYNNWLDFANEMAKQHNFTGRATDLLHDVLIDVLQKPAEKIAGMLSRKTTMIVNGEPTTELDKFILRMLRVNAFSPVAPFRKNTLGNKIIKRVDKRRVETITHVELNGTDCIDEVYNREQADRLDQMHSNNISRLQRNGFNAEVVNLYISHYMQNTPAVKFSPKDRETLQLIEKFICKKRKTLYD